MVKKKEREEEMREKIAEEERERKERVREALMAQKMEEAKKKIVELDEDGNEVIERRRGRERRATKSRSREYRESGKGRRGSSRVATRDGAPVSVERRRSRTLRVVANVARGGRRLPVPVGTRAKDIVCEFTATTFKFGLKSEPALRIPEKSKLCESIKPDDSFWTLEDNREVRLTLTKSNQ